MTAKPALCQLPPPERLALPLDADALIRVNVGDAVRSGTVLAEGTSGADILAPLAGIVSGFRRLPLLDGTADGSNALCIMLTDTAAMPPLPVPVQPLPQRLKRGGIIGLGGGAFPAWRKWRLNLNWLIANGLESAPEAQHDAALIRAAGDTLPDKVAAVARAFAAEPLLVLPDTAAAAAHPLIRRLPRQYALGQERLLIQRLCGLTVPPDEIVADYGVVCFNIATVLAIADLLTHNTPLLSRVITVHGTPAGTILLQLPFGASIGDVRRALAGETHTGQAETDAQIISARTTVLNLETAEKKEPLPCIRCGACDSVCPVNLSPQQLYQLAQNNRIEAMQQQQRLTHCLACRLCDDVCPSHIPLTEIFTDSKHRLATAAAQQRTIEHRRVRYEQHERRLAAPPPRLTAADIQRQIAAAVDRAKKAG